MLDNVEHVEHQENGVENDENHFNDRVCSPSCHCVEDVLNEREPSARTRVFYM